MRKSHRAASVALQRRAERIGQGSRRGIVRLDARFFSSCVGVGPLCVGIDGKREPLRDRFAQIEPAVLVAVDGYRYNGKGFDVRDKVADLQRQLPTLRATTTPLVASFRGTGR